MLKKRLDCAIKNASDDTGRKYPVFAEEAMSLLSERAQKELLLLLGDLRWQIEEARARSGHG